MDVRRARLRQAEQEIEALTVKLERVLAEARTLKVVLVLLLPLAFTVLAGSFARLNGNIQELDHRVEALVAAQPVSAGQFSKALEKLDEQLTETRLAVARIEERLAAQETRRSPGEGPKEKEGEKDAGHKGR